MLHHGWPPSTGPTENRLLYQQLHEYDICMEKMAATLLHVPDLNEEQASVFDIVTNIKIVSVTVSITLRWSWDLHWGWHHPCSFYHIQATST